MFNLDLTGLFAGAVPSSVPVPSPLFDGAVAFYKRKFNVHVIGRPGGGSVNLQSDYGFNIRIYRVSGSQSAGAAVRLMLPPRTNRRTIAASLALGGARAVKSTRAGLCATDMYYVTWTFP